MLKIHVTSLTFASHFSSFLVKKEGWENASSLRSKLNTRYTSIKYIVESFRSEHPEWFEMQKLQGKVSEFYHPDLVTKLIEHFKKNNDV